MDTCIRYLLENTNCSISQALRCASEHPAKLLGIFPQKGSLDYGADADLVILDDDLNVNCCLIPLKVDRGYCS